MSVSPRRCLSSTWIWEGTSPEWSNLPLNRLNPSEIVITLSLHSPSRTCHAMSLYNLRSIWSLYIFSPPLNYDILWTLLGRTTRPYWILRDDSLLTLAPFKMVLSGATYLTTGGAICFFSWCVSSMPYNLRISEVIFSPWKYHMYSSMHPAKC
jgi:hypothetical protein